MKRWFPSLYVVAILVVLVSQFSSKFSEGAMPSRAKEEPKVALPTTLKSRRSFSFAGTWSGTIKRVCQDMSFTGEVTITVSPDQKTVFVEMFSARSIRTCNRVGDALKWQEDEIPVSLQRNADGSATYSCKWIIDGTVCTAAGVLMRL